MALFLVDMLNATYPDFVVHRRLSEIRIPDPPVPTHPHNSTAEPAPAPAPAPANSPQNFSYMSYSYPPYTPSQLSYSPQTSFSQFTLHYTPSQPSYPAKVIIKPLSSPKKISTSSTPISLLSSSDFLATCVCDIVKNLIF